MILKRQFLFLDGVKAVAKQKVQLFEQFVASFALLSCNEIVALQKIELLSMRKHIKIIDIVF